MRRRASLIGLSAELKRIYSYNPETGVFIRKVQTNNRLAGTEAGTQRPDGYIGITIGRERILAHRLAWFFVYGEWPRQHIDHINGRRNDNRIVNLRLATHSQNNCNREPQINNVLGVKGVKRHRNKFVARITANGITHYLGIYDTIEEAINARREAEIKYHGTYAR